MPTTLILADQVYDGTLNAPVKNAGVVVGDDGKIAETGPAATLKGNHQQTVTVQGTLMPGLVDAHTHVVLAAGVDPGRTVLSESRTRTVTRALKHLAQHLAAGVTTIRDLGGSDGIDLDLMRAQQDGFVPGPRMLAAGTVICMTGGHACFLGHESDGTDEVVKSVRLNIKHGAMVTKLIATGGVITPGVEPGSVQLGEDELRAAVVESIHAGRRVAAHAQGTEGIMNALNAGVHSIEHGFWLDDICVQKMKERGVYLVATFAAAHGMLDNLDRLPAFIRTKMEKVADAHDRSFRMALKAGVPVACGTDAGTPFNFHGGISREIALHVHHGASTLQALHAATGAAAHLLGREDVGVIRRGALADLTALVGNPLDDLRAFNTVSHVWQSGRSVNLPQVRNVAELLAGA